MKTRFAQVAWVAFFSSFAALGCSSATDADSSELSQKTNPLTALGSPLPDGEYLYLMCNSTGWAASEATLLTAGSAANSFTIDFEVTESWMVGSGSDSCTLVQTNALGGWGSENAQYGLTTSSLEVPGAGQLAPWQGIQLGYPELGAYRATVNWGEGTLSVELADSAPSLQEEADARARDFYDYLQARFGWDGVDGHGLEPPIVINSGLENNAQWLGNFVAIGEADGVVTDSFAYSGDMIAHELVHAVNTYTAEMRPGGETGAVHESMADAIAVFSTAVNGQVDWRLAEDVWTPAIEGDALRNMETPELAPNRETLESCEFTPDAPYRCGQVSHMDDFVNSGVGMEHLNNGIPNRAAFLLVEGGEGVTGIGLIKAEQIYFRALAQHLSEWVKFSGLRHSLEISCAELTGQFGISASDCAQVDVAFDAVGISPPVLDTPAGISGTITEQGLPAVAQVTLYAGATSPPLAMRPYLTVTSDENGFFHFDEAEYLAEMEPPLSLVRRNYYVAYENESGAEVGRVASWQTDFFQESTYSEGTHLPNMELADLAMTTTSGTPVSLPMTFSWTQRSGVNEYYRWLGESDAGASLSVFYTRISTTPEFTVTDPSEITGGNNWAGLSLWGTRILAYGGTGVSTLRGFL